jgi:hypothetical protein
MYGVNTWEPTSPASHRAHRRTVPDVVCTLTFSLVPAARSRLVRRRSIFFFFFFFFLRQQIIDR